MWRLRVTKGASDTRSAVVEDGLTLGRGAEATLAILDPLVSRLHAKVLVREGAPWIVDLGSANGTEVNDRRVERQRLSAGDRIRVGDAEIVVEEVAAPPSPEPPPARSPRVRTSRPTVRIAAAVPAATRVLGDVAQARTEAGLLAEEHALGADVRSRFQRFARAAARITEADVALVLARAVAGGPHLVAGRFPDGGAGAEPPVPRSVIARAARSGEAVLLALEPAGAAADPARGRARSVGSAMFVPMASPVADAAGLYVERHDAARPFTAEDLRTFAALAAQSAPSLAQELAWFAWRAAEGALGPAPPDATLVGESAAFLAMLDVAEHVSAARAPLLIRGEPGSGRRRLARLLHDRGGSQHRPFVCVACASLPQGDEAAALFGELEDGRRRPGLVEDVGFGTLCLVEIADLARGAQRALADAVAGGRYLPVGADEARVLRCRIVATTSRNLDQLVAAGEFHGPLAAALAGISVGVPPLAERGDDLVLLAAHFAAIHGRKRRGRPLTLTESAREALRRRSFPGNVAELSNVVEAAALRATGDSLDAADLEPGGPRDRPPPDLTLRAAERVAIVRALEASGGRRGRAAELLGISWPTLTRKIREYGIGEV